MTKKVINVMPNAENYLYCPMIDARRMEVFCALYDYQLQLKLPIQPLVVTQESFKTVLEDKKILFFGDGAAKCQTTIEAKNAFFLENIHPEAACIGELAWQKWQLQQTEDIAYFEPFYLKEFYNTTKK
jgi:tRNA threonylcarbamoyladenosine biosynthesis protein TsaB